MDEGRTGRTKIAILGGGAGALAAAFGLTERPGWSDDYEITVYQQGWRLGGKGASGRNLEMAGRIEEHGLHVWAGFYENAFRMMARCYAELGRDADAPLATLWDAFQPHDFITLEEHIGDRWIHWHIDAPRHDGTPGDGDEPPTPWGCVRRALAWMVRLCADSAHAAEPHPDHPGWPHWLDHVLQRAHAVLASVREIEAGTARLARVAEETAVAFFESALEAVEGPRAAGPVAVTGVGIATGAEGSAIIGIGAEMAADSVAAPPGGTPRSPLDHLHAARTIARACPEDPHLHPAATHHGILWLLDAFLERFHAAADRRIEQHDETRRLWILLDLIATHIRGLIRDGVLLKGFEAIDGEDWSAWLRHHGASPRTLESAIVRATYDYIFGYERGDPRRPWASAGVCVRGLARMFFTAKGALFYRMQAGMGDAVFAPLYQVLRNRGVRFAFFHRVEGLGLAADQESIASIRVARQARLKCADYDPLVTVKGLPCWPAAPLYDQIVEGPELRARGIDLEASRSDWEDVGHETLRVGVDFDRVVLGIPLGGLRDVAGELIAARPEWRDMVEHVRTVPTRSVQLWLGAEAAELGWRWPATVGSGFAEPHSDWADLSHLIAREDWPAAGSPRSLAYLCGPLDECEPAPAEIVPGAERQRVGREAIAWLRRHAAHLWQGLVDDASGDLRWDLLVDPRGRAGPERFEAQYWRANVYPSDRYVLSAPGSSRFRLGADESGFDNLVLAGDWVRTPLSAGCVEAAVMAGLQAARAIDGHPRTIAGEEHWHRPRHHRPEPRPAAAPHSGRPLYVAWGGQQTFTQPGESLGVRFYSFFLESDPAALRRLCNAHLNHPAQGAVSVEPLLPRIMLSFADIARLQSLVEPDRDMGWIPEVDAVLAVPVVIRKLDGSRGPYRRLAWFIPYIVVDSAWACISGREIYGFPKEVGTFRIPRRPGDPALFAVDTLVFDRFGPETRGAIGRLVEVRRIDAETLDAPGSTMTDIREAYRDLLSLLVGTEGPSLLADPGLVWEAFDDLLRLELPLVFLKQFRDATDGRRACYQAIVEANLRMHNLKLHGALSGDYRVTIGPFDSHPIVRDLGLAGPSLEAVAALYTEYDFVMEPGVELWRA